MREPTARWPLQPLPIDPLLPAIGDTVRRERRLVLEAPPGVGKTTRVPAELLAGLGDRAQRVLVLEPRRLAARLAAQRVALERGEKLGGSVGYQVRFESAISAATRLLFMTEGLFARRLLDDRELAGVGCVVLDEFHERHLHTDLALAWLHHLQQTTRPDLQLVVMSATLESAPVAAFLDQAPVLRAPGQRFDVAVEHAAHDDDRPLEVQVRSTVLRLLRDGLDGDVLVFLPGAAEIRRCRAALDAIAADSDLELHLLHGDLPAAEQDAAIRPSTRRKVILSTNVAESSITVDNVAAVIDSGLARIASQRPWSGLPALELRPIARAAVEQRTGRAGRTRSGRCLRLFTAGDLATRPPHERPEIARSDLAELALTVGQLTGRADRAALDWLEPPAAPAWQAAVDLLRQLSALDDSGALTAIGQQLLRWPTHPRLGKLLLEAHRCGVFEPACAIAALLGERDIVARRGLDRPTAASAVSGSDLIDRGELLAAARGARFAASALDRLGLDAGAVHQVERARQQLLGLRPITPSSRATAAEREHLLQQCTLLAFGDRVARRRPGTRELVLASGGEARLAEESAVQDSPWLVAVDASERRHGTHTTVVAQLASAIEPDWLIDLFPDRVAEQDEVSFDEAHGRVSVVSRLCFGQLALTETRRDGRGHAGAARVLADQAFKRGLSAICDVDKLAELRQRLQLAAELDPASGLASVSDGDLRALVERLALECATIDELRRQDLEKALNASCGPRGRARLDALCPPFVALPGRKRAPVHYPEGAPPFVASFIQDFFGLDATPTLGGRQPLQLQLLAPSKRPVQVTTDLPGFWRNHYPAIRKELCRRYPRHRWPEDPVRATR